MNIFFQTHTIVIKFNVIIIIYNVFRYIALWLLLLLLSLCSYVCLMMADSNNYNGVYVNVMNNQNIHKIITWRYEIIK